MIGRTYENKLQATAIVVTRGDVDCSEIMDDLDEHFDKTILWNNAYTTVDLSVLGRYVAMEQWGWEWIYVQDDDHLPVVEQIAAAAESEIVVCNMPSNRRGEYPGPDALVGYGAIFQRGLVKKAFDRYLAHYPVDALFMRECDRIFTGLNICKAVDVPVKTFDHANAANRLWRDPNHLKIRAEIRRRLVQCSR